MTVVVSTHTPAGYNHTPTAAGGGGERAGSGQQQQRVYQSSSVALTVERVKQQILYTDVLSIQNFDTYLHCFDYQN